MLYVSIIMHFYSLIITTTTTTTMKWLLLSFQFIVVFVFLIPVITASSILGGASSWLAAIAAKQLQTQLLLATSGSLLLPPTVRLKLPNGEDDLKQECYKLSTRVTTSSTLADDSNNEEQSNFVWGSGAQEGYQVATLLFDTLASSSTTSSISTTLWFPHFENIQMLQCLTQVINTNSNRLGGIQANVQNWPKVPCGSITLLNPGDTTPTKDCLKVEQSMQDKKLWEQQAILDTEKWVNETLCRLRLCPYTASMTRAAVGLESAEVSEGPIVIRTSTSSGGSSYDNDKIQNSNQHPANAAAAAILAQTFWHGVTELATKSEKEVATSLLIAPSIYDIYFDEFVNTCDQLIEASVQVVHADNIVGRAWFHPSYTTSSDKSNNKDDNADVVVAGHALPPAMVEGFVKQYYPDQHQELLFADIVRANNAVRWTPHATINLLRRSQLTAAKQVEAVTANKKPNAIYARNILKLLEEEQ